MTSSRLRETLCRAIVTVCVLCQHVGSSSAQVMNESACAGNASNQTATNSSQCLDEGDPFESCPDPDLCVLTKSLDNVGLAFGLTIAAGMATSLGALLPFVPCVKRSNTHYLAAGLGLAAGVMLYVSFTEIWTKAKFNFCCASPAHADLATTACFFGGIMITIVLDLFVTLLQKMDCGCVMPCRAMCRRKRELSSPQLPISSETSADSFHLKRKNEIVGNTVDPLSEFQDSGVSVSMETSQQDESEMCSSEASLGPRQEEPADVSADLSSEEPSSRVPVNESGLVKGSGLIHRNSYQDMVDLAHESAEPLGSKEFKEVSEGLGKDTKRLHKMGILTGLAIAIHNFPEGLATFVATLSSPSLGAALCIAVALHNIPEGVCVAMPVYYATGSRWKGFLWAFLSGISEPLGALLGWLVLKDVFGPLVYGILFGLIAGMMVFISLKELLPTARKFDKSKGVLVNVFLVIGMLVMAISLLLFLY